MRALGLALTILLAVAPPVASASATAATPASASGSAPEPAAGPSVPPAAPGSSVVFAGGYGRDGIVRFGAGGAGLARVSTMGSPTALVAHPARRLVYAASELSGGRANLRVVGSDGRERARAWSGGANPVALALDPAGRRLAVANYDGSIAVLALDGAGLPQGAPAVVRTTGRGPHPRQASSHPHGVTFSPDGTQLYAADLGSDQILRFAIEPAALRPLPAVTMTRGSGPRQVVLVGPLAFVPTELDAHVDVLAVASDGGLTPVQRIALGGGFPAGLAVHPGGAWAVALLRGPDECIVLRVSDLDVRIHARAPCAGRPRALAWDGPARLLVAAQSGNRIDEHTFDAFAGTLVRRGTLASVQGAAGLALLPNG